MNLSDLQELAERINKESDELTKAIRSIEDAVKSLNIGIPVWIKVPNGSLLGYVRFKDGWHFAVCDNETAQPRPILGATRIERVALCAHLPQILTALRKECDRVTAEIQAALPELKKAVELIEEGMTDEQRRRIEEEDRGTVRTIRKRIRRPNSH